MVTTLLQRQAQLDNRKIVVALFKQRRAQLYMRPHIVGNVTN